jgi:NADPH-dependent curcumin reductase CurA
MTELNKKIVLKSRPATRPDDSNFEYREEQTAELTDGMLMLLFVPL